MLNLRARQYEPAQARFSQRDSLKGSVASPRSLNAYLYCQNDAINFFDASGAAMMAVNMTDGGGRSAAMRVSNVAATVATAVKQVTAAAVAKEANTHALTQTQVSSILKERNNPASVLQQARANRTKALENTSAVSGSKNTACMSQEEYDNFWTKLFNILFPSSCAPKSTTTPQPTSTPVPPHEVIEVRIPKPSITPGPTPAPTPQPTSTSTPDYKTQKIKEFSAYVYKEVENHSFYVWGGYGQSIYRFKNEEEAEQYLTDKTKEWGKRARQSRNVPLEEYDDNLEAVLTHYRDAKENGYDAHMFDCSGLYSAWGIENGFFEKKHNVAQLKKLCDLSIPYDQIQEGDWVFKPGHIGYVIGFTDSNEPIIGQAEGHVPGLTIRPYSETGEWEIRRPNYEKIFGGGN